MTELERVAAILHAALSFPVAWKLTAQPYEIIDSRLLGERLLLTWSSELSGASIRMYYSAPEGGRPASIATFIDSGGSPSIFLDDYLLERGPAEMLERFRNSQPAEPVEVFGKRYADAIRLILETEYLDLLRRGSSNHASFDWCSYK